MRALPLLILVACAGDVAETADPTAPELADAVAAAVSGGPGGYTFAVTLRSPDTGCERYADWWEVVSADGSALVYRRILGHSHVDEQPFTRSLSGVEIPSGTGSVEVRARDSVHGLGGRAVSLDLD